MNCNPEKILWVNKCWNAVVHHSHCIRALLALFYCSLDQDFNCNQLGTLDTRREIKH